MIRLIVLLLLIVAAPAWARGVTDSAGRQVAVPDRIDRVLAAGPPASALLYVLAPEKLIGWVRAPRPAELPYLLPAVRNLPEIGRLTGRGDTLNLERLVAEKPDLIVDFGTTGDIYRSLADRVQAQTGIPYLVIDGRFAATPGALRLLGGILGVDARAEALALAAERILAAADRVVAAVPADRRPRVYLARGAQGLESGSRGSINTEIIERAGAINVVDGLRDKGGIVTVSPEQVLAWAPQVIITLDAGFRDHAATDPVWRSVPAVAAGRVHLAPSLPYGFIDAPPSVNRLIGLTWMLHKLYPGAAPGELRAEVRNFCRLFYQVELDDAAIDRLLAGG